MHSATFLLRGYRATAPWLFEPMTDMQPQLMMMYTIGYKSVSHC